MGQELHEETKIPHSGGSIGRIEPTGAADSTGKTMGPTGGVDSGTALTPMKAGIGEIPVDGKSSSVPSAGINGLLAAPVDGMKVATPDSGGSPMGYVKSDSNGPGGAPPYPGL